MSFQVFLVLLEGPKRLLEVEDKTTIRELRKMVEAITKIRPEEQRLVCGAKELQDEYQEKEGTIKAYDIKSGVTIFLLLRLRGGCDSKKNLTCIICYLPISGAPKICCSQSHAICSGDCYDSFIENVVLPACMNGFLPECPQCKLKYTPELFASIIAQLPAEKQLELEKKMLYYSLSYKVVHEDEVRVPCPTPMCEYVEIHTKTKGADSLKCRICKKEYCIYCRKLTSEDHAVCGTYGYIKLAFEDAITEGNIRRCPECRSGGTKDDKCTHMTCRVCNKDYCYVCLKNTAEVGGDFTKHRNADFAKDTSHCPMYLNYFPTYKGLETVAVQAFHQNLTLRYVQSVLKKFGSAGELTYTLFNIEASAGFSLTEVQTLKPYLLAQTKLAR